MNLRIGLVDICAILVLLVVLFMPPQGMSFIGAYDFRSEGDQARDVKAEVIKLGELQAAMIRNPSNGQIAAEYAYLLQDLGRHDMAIRVAATAASLPDPSNWRAESSVSSSFTVRATRPVVVNANAIRRSLVWAKRAKESCAKAGEIACPPGQALRLQLAFEDLKFGVEKLEKGSFDPRTFRGELHKTRPMIRSGK